MDDQRFGAAIRAARVRRRSRQADLALAAGVSRPTISRIERGLVDELSVRTLRRVAAALDVRLELLPRARGADLDRLVNARHARLVEAVVQWLTGVPGWIVRPEVSFAWYGERGVIDLLAWYPVRRILLVIEVKTAIVDVGELLGTLGRKVRLAARAAEPLGWRPAVVATLLVIADSDANRRAVSAHRATLRAALPVDGRSVGRWLAAPAGGLAAIRFLANARRGNVAAGFAAVRRVRRPSAG